MMNLIRKTKTSICEVVNVIILTGTITFIFSCSKQEVLKENSAATIGSSTLQINYLAKIRASLQDSLNANDFSALNLNKFYKSKDVRSKNYFVRLEFKSKKISDDFILLKTDSAGNVIKGKIIHVKRDKNQKINANITLVTSSLNRKSIIYLKNTVKKNNNSSYSKNPEVDASSNVSSLLAEEPVGEQTLPDVIVTGYIYDDPVFYYWYCFDDILGMSTGGGGTYTYGSSAPQGGGGSTGYSDETINITYENADQSPIDITKYIKCFSTLSNESATFKISIYSDIPVNNDPSKLFDFSTGACGHTFLQLTKSNGGTVIQQNIGFYPESGWKSIEANGPVASKLVDNAGHEFNASLTVSVDAAHFQTALNEIQYYCKLRYDIDNFNCTDFALKVFNSAAPLYLDIPQYHIPGGMFGETSNTPQGLYNELVSLNKSGRYAGYGEIAIPGVAGYVGNSHGGCN